MKVSCAIWVLMQLIYELGSSQYNALDRDDDRPHLCDGPLHHDREAMRFGVSHDLEERVRKVLVFEEVWRRPETREPVLQLIASERPSDELKKHTAETPHVICLTYQWRLMLDQPVALRRSVSQSVCNIPRFSSAFQGVQLCLTKVCNLEGTVQDSRLSISIVVPENVSRVDVAMTTVLFARRTLILHLYYSRTIRYVGASFKILNA